ncbi:MAG TPA: hypothetical protein VFS21_10620 [Roseiflexaceae bacterium]|nr:hypothetical protein [Roseiflexaceae bacterium]
MSDNGHSTGWRTAAQEQEPQADATPQLIFTIERDSAAVLDLLRAPGLLDTLAARRYGVALGVERLDEPTAAAARLLGGRAAPLVAWLKLPPEDGYAFNLRNYPQALDRYRAFRAWALEQQLAFDAVGLELAAPPGLASVDDLTLRGLVHRLRLATEYVLYSAGRSAYIELFALMRQDGYEIHTYQLPFVADDRRAGTTLVQRALDVVDLPSDLDVLMCSSAVPSERLGSDLGGALIASYGPSADAVGIGGVSDEQEEDGISVLPWPALRRDLLLAARYTDTIYVESLEGCVERGLLDEIGALDWSAPAQPWRRRRALVGAMRAAIFAVLTGARFGPRALAWSGWALAALLWLRGRRATRRTAGAGAPKNTSADS